MKRVTREKDTELAEVFRQTGKRLQDLGFALGAIFIGRRDSDEDVEYGLLFRDGMPQQTRMGLLEDLQKALNASRDTFQM